MLITIQSPLWQCGNYHGIVTMGTGSTGRSSVHQISKAGPVEQLVKGPAKASIMHKWVQRLAWEVVLAWCMAVDHQQEGNGREAKITGYMTVPNQMRRSSSPLN